MKMINFDSIEKLSVREKKNLAELLTPKLTHYIPHIPTAKQAVFLLLPHREAFYGGAAGGGKSDALLMGALQYVDTYGYAGIIFRKSFADLNKPGALIPRAKEWLRPFSITNGGDVQWQEKQNRFMFYERYGKKRAEKAVLQFGYLGTEKDLENYQGGEYQFIGFDELTHFKASYYTYMFSRLRRLKDMSIPLRVRAASNPPQNSGGIWVYDRFVNEETRKRDAVFIPAGLDDNPFLDKEEYEASLRELDPVTRARLRDGNWEIRYKGNMFSREWCSMADILPNHRKTVRYWDLAATEVSQRNKDPDWTVGVKMSVSRGIYYLEDVVRFRYNPGQTEEMIAKIAMVDGKRVMIRMEEEPGSSGKNNTSHYARKVLRGYDFKGIRSTGNKIVRAGPLSAAMSRGDVFIRQGCRNLDCYWDELEGFPGPHDDMVDGSSGAFNALADLPSLGLPIGLGVGSTSYWTPEQIDQVYIPGFWKGP